MDKQEKKISNMTLNKPKDVKRLIANQINKIRKAGLDIETESQLIARLSQRLLDSMKYAEIEKEVNEIKEFMREAGMKK